MPKTTNVRALVWFTLLVALIIAGIQDDCARHARRGAPSVHGGR